MLKQTLLEVISRLYRVKLHHDSWGVKCWRGEIYILIDARIHDTVNTRPCNTASVLNKERGWLWPRRTRCKHTGLGACLFLRTLRGLFLRGDKTGETHIARWVRHSNSETQQSKPNRPAVFTERLFSLTGEKTSHFTLLTCGHVLGFSPRFSSLLSRRPGVALFFSLPVKSERRRKQESSEAWPESRGSMTSYGSIFQVQASSE